MNRVILHGRLGKDPEVKALPSGHTVANMSLATDEPGKKGADGTREKRTEWHNLTAWGRTAELAGKYLKKGSQVLVEGRLETRSYEKDGIKHYATSIVVDRLEFTGSKPAGDRGAASPAEEAHPVGTYDDPDGPPF